MTTVKAFDEMMNQFIGEITQVFPDEPSKTPVDLNTFMKQISSWVPKMTARDDEFFSEDNEFAKSMGLHIIWKRADCTENTKQAIWQYLQSLYMIGTTLSMFPPETLSAIEAAAENCAKNMKMNPNGQLDEKALMAGVNSMLSQMMSGGANNPFASIMGSMPQQRPQPRPGSRKKKSSR
jgi:hypothetical protein